MYNSCEEKDVLQCPYNKHHIISVLRYSRHLVKCEKNYPNNLKVICPYNATHRLNKSDIEQHIKHCPAKTTVEAYFFPLNDHNKIDTKLEEHSSGTENNIEDISEDLEDPENSLSYALENTLSLEKDKRLVDNLQDNQSKFKFMTAVESLSNKKEEEICDRKPRQKMTHDYSVSFLDDESIVSREVSMVGRRAIGRGKISDYSDSLTDESIRGEESLVALRAIGRGRPMSSHAERLRRFRMKGGKTGGRVPKII